MKIEIADETKDKIVMLAKQLWNIALVAGSMYVANNPKYAPIAVPLLQLIGNHSAPPR